jgi:hypothetical protein
VEQFTVTFAQVLARTIMDGTPSFRQAQWSVNWYDGWPRRFDDVDNLIVAICDTGFSL